MNKLVRRAMATALVISFIGLTACDQAEQAARSEPAAKKVDPAQAELSIEKAQAARIAALNNRDVDGAVSVYAPNATLVIPNVEPLSDPTAIRANYASLLGDQAVKMIVTPTQTWVSAGADFAVTTAQITITSEDAKRTVASSTNQSVWQRQADGTWKIVSEYSVAVPSRRQETADLAGDVNSRVPENTKQLISRAETVPAE